MVPSFFNLFFIDNLRSKELQKRLIALNTMSETLLTPKEPIKTGRVSSKYQHIVDDYYKCIEEINAQKQSMALMMELIIGLAYQVDFSTNPNTNDEIFRQLSRESKGLRTKKQ